MIKWKDYDKGVYLIYIRKYYGRSNRRSGFGDCFLFRITASEKIRYCEQAYNITHEIYKHVKCQNETKT